MDKLKAWIESHQGMVAVILGGGGILATIYVARRISQGNQNTATGVPTDASGNSIYGGMQVSPPMSQTDVAAMLQDMENQLLNWEQQFQQQNGNPPPPPPPNNQQCPPGYHWVGLPVRFWAGANPGFGRCVPDKLPVDPNPPPPPHIIPTIPTGPTGPASPIGPNTSQASNGGQIQNGPAFATVGHWPNWDGSLWGIAQHYGDTLAQIEAFPENRYIFNRSGSWDLIYPNQRVRVK